VTELQCRAMKALSEIKEDLEGADSLVKGIGTGLSFFLPFAWVASLPARIINKLWYADYIKQLEAVIRGERFTMPERPEPYRPAGR
jgi:hypothetical protein